MGTVPQTELRSSSPRITYCIRAGCWLLRRRGSLAAVRRRPARLRVKSRRRRRGRASSPRKSTPDGSEGGGCMGAAREKGRNIRRWGLPRLRGGGHGGPGGADMQRRHSSPSTSTRRRRMRIRRRGSRCAANRFPRRGLGEAGPSFASF
jgi:hypothetical protein